ncbi:hypothetical protein J6590_023190 [Homalodisca vitripennis]|nr:hypothetical protein J6590_023190 [Homalodisca vitripennis]
MQRSESALLRSAPGTSGFRCWEYGGRARGNWARGLVLEGTPVPDFSGPPLPHDALRLRKEFLPSTNADPFGKSSRVLRSPPSRPQKRLRLRRLIRPWLPELHKRWVHRLSLMSLGLRRHQSEVRKCLFPWFP